MKKILVLVAAVVALASCSNGSDNLLPAVVLSGNTEGGSKSPVYSRTGEVNKTTSVDLGITLSDEYKEITPNDLGVTWVFVSNSIWEKYFEGKQEGNALFLKPVLKVESDSRGVVFCHSEGFTSFRDGHDVVVDEWAYKCIVYSKISSTSCEVSVADTSGIIYKGSNPKRGYYIGVYYGQRIAYIAKSETINYLPW